MSPDDRRRELAAFLRSRRQRQDPREHGFPHGHRRGPGLRREEVAALAAVSVSWYTWLEQARDVRPSAEVLTSLARALRLDEAELDYLLRLGGHAAAPRGNGQDPRTDPQLRALVDSFLPNPASIVTPSFDYVVWNRASEGLIPGFLGHADAAPHNLLRFIFGGAAGRSSVKAEGGDPAPLVARLRENAARHPECAGIGPLVEELEALSPLFHRTWSLYEVPPLGPPPDVALRHPAAGRLRFQQVDLRPETHPDLTLVVFLPRDLATGAGVHRLVA